MILTGLRAKAETVVEFVDQAEVDGVLDRPGQIAAGWKTLGSCLLIGFGLLRPGRRGFSARSS